VKLFVKTNLFLALASVSFPALLASQSASLRLSLPDRFSAMRPEVFEIERAAVAPVRPDLDQLTRCGRFLGRQGEDPALLPPKLGIDGRLHQRAGTRLAVATNGDTLRLIVECEEPFPERMGNELDDYYADDRVEMMIDLDHDHHDFFLITVWPSGDWRVESFEVSENHLAWDRRLRQQGRSLEAVPGAARTETGWRAVVDLKLPLPVDVWQVVGLNVVRRRGVDGEETTMWCPDRMNVYAPLYFGDLYLGSPPTVVRSVRLGQVCRGDNRGEMATEQAPDGLGLAAANWNFKETCRQGEYSFSDGRCAFDYWVDPLELMDAALELSLAGRHWGSYEFGWKRSILLTQRPTGRFQEPRPQPGDDDYCWKFARYVLDRLPALYREADGLTLTDGYGIRVDLRREDALEALAQVVMERLEGDDERLAGAALLLCQPGVLVSSSTGESLAHRQSGLGLLRVGAGFCNSYGELLRDLINRIRNSRGRLFQACVVNYVPGSTNTFGWPHHWLAAVRYRGGLTLLDSELGTFFVVPEEGRLATLDDLLGRPELADLSGYGLSEYFRDREIDDFMVREAGDLWELPE